MKGLKGRFAKVMSASLLSASLVLCSGETVYAAGGESYTSDETDGLYPDMINPDLVESLNRNDNFMTLEEVTAAYNEGAENTDDEGKTTTEFNSEFTAEETKQELRIATGEFVEVNREYREMEAKLTDMVLVSPSAKENVIVYREASTDSEKAGTMEPGDGADVIAETEDWYQIVSGQTEGYIKKTDVISGTQAAVAVVEQLGMQAVVDAEVMNIRLDSSTDADILDVAAAGNIYRLVESGKEWTKILYIDGVTIGYVATEFVHVEPAIGEALSVEEEAAIRAAAEAEARRRAEEEAARKAAEEEAARRAAEEEAARRAAEAEAARVRAAAEEKARQEAAKNSLPEGSLQYMGTFRVTYYCACLDCCSGGFGRTASGTIPVEGRTIAVDPGQIPYGTHVIINGHEYVAEDTGVGVNQVDIFVDSHERALQLGLDYYDVYVKR